MRRRSLFFLPVFLPFFSFMQSPIVAHGAVDEYEEYLHYWCPTPEMIEKARAQHTNAQSVYRVMTDYDFDV